MATNSKNNKKDDVVVKDIYGRVRVAQTDTIKDDRDKGKHEKPEKLIDPDVRFKDLKKACSYLTDKD